MKIDVDATKQSCVNQARSIALSIACDIHPLCNLRVVQYVGEERKSAWIQHWLKLGTQGKSHSMFWPERKFMGDRA